jgi:hypothetical protein
LLLAGLRAVPLAPFLKMRLALFPQFLQLRVLIRGQDARNLVHQRDPLHRHLRVQTRQFLSLEAHCGFIEGLRLGGVSQELALLLKTPVQRASVVPVGGEQPIDGRLLLVG